MAGGQVWIPVNASMKGFASTVAKEATRAAGAGGRELETGFKKSGEAAGKAAADGLAAQAGKVDAASRALATARKAETQAAADARVEEEKLRQLRDSGNASAADIVKAETAIQTAKAKAADASERVAARETDLENVRQGGEVTSSQIFRAEDRLSAARIKQAEAAGKEKAAELALEDAQRNAAGATERVESATAALADARSTYGADSREAADAEKELTSAKRDADKAAIEVARSEGAAEKAKTNLANATDDAKSKTLLLEGVQRDLADAEEQAAKEADEAADSVSKLGDELDDAAEKGGGFGGRIMDGLKKVGHGALLGIGAKIGTSVMDGVQEAVSTGWETAMSIDQVSRSLSAMTSETQVAEDMMVSLREVASGSPIDYTSFLEGANTLAYMGYEGDRAIDVMDNVGRAAVGAGRDGDEAMQSVIGALGKMQANGKVTANEIGQISNTGVPMLSALIDHFGMAEGSFGELSSMISEGKVGLEDVIDALEEAGGKDFENLHNSFENVNSSLENQIAMLKDDVFTSIGESLQPILNDLDFEAIADALGNGIGRVIEVLPGIVDVAITSFGALSDVVGDVVDKGQALIAWGQENIDWIMPLVGSLGVLTAAYQALKFQQTVMAAGGFIKWLKQLNAVQKISTGITKAQTAAQAAFNLVMNANPVFLVVTAVAALAAGLVLFFTKTETGREMWSKFTDALATGWEWVSEKFSAGVEWIKEAWGTFTDALQAGWENWIKPVFDGFVNAGKVLFAVLATAVIAPLQIAWNLLSDAIAWAWENRIQPAWEMMKTAASFMWNNVLKPVFGFIKSGWDLLSAGIQAAYHNIIVPVWDALKAAASFMWNSVLMPIFGFIQSAWTGLSNTIKWAYDTIILPVWKALQNAASHMWNVILMPIFGWIQDAWTGLSNAIKWAYDTIIKPTWDALSNALSWLYNSVVQPTLQWIRDRWDDMAGALHAGYVWIKDKVFGGLQTALDVVKDAFGIARDAIGRAWDGIKAKAAAPVKFVIETVFNNGIVEAWNKVADWVGLDPINKYEPAWLGQFAEGTSRVPGPRTKDDNVHMVSTDGRFGLSLRGGEGVVVPEVVDALGPAQIDGMNAAAKVGGTQGVLRYLGGFAGGGVIGSITDIVNRFYPGMSITSTLRPGDPGHHGSGLAVDFSNGTDSTPEMRSAAQFFYKNYGPALLELIHSPFGNNVKDGANVGDGFGFYGAGTMNGHRNHVHVAAASPLPEPGDPITPVPSGGGGGGGVINWLRNRVADVLDSVFNPIKEMIPDLGGLIGGLPKAAFSKMTGAVSDFIRGKADEHGAYYGDVGAGVEQWRGLVEEILEAKGFSVGLADTTLRRMDQESGGNPRAINNWDSNAAKGTPSKGLMQVIDPTFATHKDPGYDDIWDPESNIRASMNYAVATYGSLPAAYNKAGGYHAGGLAPAGQGILHKTALEPEMVLSPPMTEAFINWMQGTPQGESAAVVAQELASAFAGEDWGYAELASYIGRDLAKATVDVVAAIGRADRGFQDWAKATEDQDRMGTPEEWATHFGQQAAYAIADEGLGLLGLDGMINKPLRQSLVDLVNAAVPYANEGLKPHRGVMGQVGLGDFYFGELSTGALQPVALLDDEGRRTGTKLAADTGVAAATPEVGTDEPDVEDDGPDDMPDGPDVDDDNAGDGPSVATTGPDVATDAPTIDNTSTASASAAGGTTTVIELEGGKVYAPEDLVKVNERVDGVEFRVKKLEDDQTADVNSGVSLLV